MTNENPLGESLYLSTHASEYSSSKKRRIKPAEYEDYALKIYKQPEDIINTKFDNAMKFVLPSVKKLELVPLVTLNGCDALTLEEQFMYTIENTPLETWKEYDEFVAKQEQRCLSEDLMTMEIVDDIQTAARNLRLVMSKRFRRNRRHIIKRILPPSSHARKNDGDNNSPDRVSLYSDAEEDYTEKGAESGMDASSSDDNAPDYSSNKAKTRKAALQARDKLKALEKTQDLLTYASEPSTTKKRRNKPAEYEDYALKIYKQPEDIINTKFDSAMKFVLPSVKKLELVPLVTVNKIKKFSGTTYSGSSKSFSIFNKTTKNCVPNSIDMNKPVSTTGYGVLQQIMLRYYMEKYKTLLPTNAITYDARSLFNIPNSRRRQYNFKRLIKDLSAKGFVTQRFAYTYRNFTSEDPKIVIDRIFYFEKIREYRESGRNIVHVVTALENLLITVSPMSELKQCYKKVFNRKEFRKVIKKYVIPILPANSVLIVDYDQRSIKIKKPSTFTSKKTMKIWLTKIGVSYDNNAHKAELYNLIKKHRHLGNQIYCLEEALEKHGHTVLWKPKISKISCIQGILTLLHEKLQLNGSDTLTLEEQFVNTIENTPLDTWKEYDEFVAKQEQQCLSDDLVMMEIIDNIQTAARNLRLIMSELKVNVSLNCLRRVLRLSRSDTL
ncbi:hypothetical protein K1T71_013346 [Dendrolimus kikuchii]|uniref:Uncharacterized protein n=1 Tax=Dendrolimus kikuchii TaxID=765133 RepID=A0ACC1CI40_9NEOP|nr:hypothetical protein K1T71_013346 [Dendrolimus kikuchii]